MRDPQIDDPLKDLPPLLTLEETANLFRVTTRTLRRWIRMGRIHALRTAHDGSGRVLVEKSEVRRAIEAMKERVPPEAR